MSTAKEDAANLSHLLKALGAGARAVQALPLRNENEDGDADNSNDDEFAFESSFPEFAAALAQAQESERTVLITLLQDIATHTDALLEGGGDEAASSAMSTAVLYEQCATACELLLEQVELYLQDKEQPVGARQQLSNWSQTARQKSTSTWATILANTVEMEKPQITYDKPEPCNGRTQVFVPPHQKDSDKIERLEGHGHDSCHATLPTAGGGPPQQLRSNKTFAPETIVAPSHHVPHLWQGDIRAFCPTEWELEPLLERPTPLSSVSEVDASWIDTTTALQELGQVLSSLSSPPNNNKKPKYLPMIAIDLEAHSYRSFAGMVCLMQLSIVTLHKKDASSPPNDKLLQTQNYLIDTLALSASDIHQALQPSFLNPSIVKVLHGADSDIPWLQRDFGLYVVHLWDTGRAARALNFPSASYAYLLQRYCLSHNKTTNNENLVANIVQNKQQFQLSDWRQRPLPSGMQQYAIADTHFLIYIAHHLKWELQQPAKKTDNNSNTNASMLQVLDTSRLVALIRYPGPPLFMPDGYQTLLATRGGRRQSKGKSKKSQRQQQNQCTPMQEHVLKALWDWRDATAREQDESLSYICPNHILLRLAMSMPAQSPLPANLSLPNPSLEPDAIRVVQSAAAEYSNMTGKPTEMMQQGKYEYGDDEDEELNGDDLNMGDDEMDMNNRVSGSSKNKGKVQSKTSAFFKPAMAAKDRQRRGMMSPVMGTEDLYKQAGWMTPEEEAATGAAVSGTPIGTSGEDNDDEEDDDDAALVEEVHTSATGSEGEEGTPKRVMKIAMGDATAALDLKPRSNPATPTDRKTSGSVASRSGGSRSADGFASSRAARDSSKSPVPGSNLEEDVSTARQSSSQIRNDLLENHHINVLGLLTAATAADGGDDQDDDDDAMGTSQLTSPGSERGKGQQQEDENEGGTSATGTGEEDFNIPRSMREIYKISNRNRKYKKSVSPTPDRGGPTPSSEKELAELQKAEALLRERGMDAAGFLFATTTTNTKKTESSGEGGANSSGKNRARKQEGDSGNLDGSNVFVSSKQDDVSYFREIGWIPPEETDSNIMAECYGPQGGNATGGPENAGGATKGNAGADVNPAANVPAQNAPVYAAPSPFDYSQATGPAGQQPHSLHPTPQQPANNPFFSGAALQGGPLAQNFRTETSKTSRKGGGGNNNNPRNNNNSSGRGRGRGSTTERPEKRDGGRSHVYRSNSNR